MSKKKPRQASRDRVGSTLKKYYSGINKKFVPPACSDLNCPARLNCGRCECPEDLR